jgi:hypothetical protein
MAVTRPHRSCWAWYGREGTLGFRGLWRSRAKPAAAIGTLPYIHSLASDETYRGGYLITEEPDSPAMFLTVPLPKNNRDGTGAYRHLTVSVPPEMLEAGQFYLIGGPGEESCEVVRVEAEVVPGQPRRIRRHLFRTFGPFSHPAGTRVRRVTVERVFDWAQWEAGRRAEPSDPGPPDTAGTESHSTAPTTPATRTRPARSAGTSSGATTTPTTNDSAASSTGQT